MDPKRHLARVLTDPSPSVTDVLDAAADSPAEVREAIEALRIDASLCSDIHGGYALHTAWCLDGLRGDNAAHPLRDLADTWQHSCCRPSGDSNAVLARPLLAALLLARGPQGLREYALAHQLVRRWRLFCEVRRSHGLDDERLLLRDAHASYGVLIDLIEARLAEGAWDDQITREHAEPMITAMAVTLHRRMRLERTGDVQVDDWVHHGLSAVMQGHPADNVFTHVDRSAQSALRQRLLAGRKMLDGMHDGEVWHARPGRRPLPRHNRGLPLLALPTVEFTHLAWLLYDHHAVTTEVSDQDPDRVAWRLPQWLAPIKECGDGDLPVEVVQTALVLWDPQDRTSPNASFTGSIETAQAVLERNAV